MSERTGVLAAVLSSALGGVAAAATRFVIGGTDPVTLGAHLLVGVGAVFAGIWIASTIGFPAR